MEIQNIKLHFQSTLFFIYIAIATFVILFGAASTVKGVTDLCPRPEPRGSGNYADICDHVFRIVCHHQTGIGTLSGFCTRVDGVSGIVTALHGVLHCNEITASNLKQSLHGLRVKKVDVRRDVAFLTTQNETGPEIRAGDARLHDTVRFVGYTLGITYQKSRPLEPDRIRPWAKLKELLPPHDRVEFQERGSPDPDITVLSLSGPLTHGESGGPILTESGQVIAVANGGLLKGTIGMNWAIPYDEIKWHTFSDVKSILDNLTGRESEELFGVTRESKPMPTLYLADGGDPIGRIYKLKNDDLFEYYKRDRGRIYNLAIANDGTIYFSDSNDRYLYKLEDGREVRVYTHSTYLRDIEFDPLGRLYFSESTGAGDDGIIYRIEDGEAMPFFRVRLSDVDGFWAGDFSFDNSGFLWLSSGNRVPANLYKVVEQQPKLMFTDSGSISGFAFTQSGDILYTDWRQSVQRLSLPGPIAESKSYSFGTFKSLSDVEPEKRKR